MNNNISKVINNFIYETHYEENIILNKLEDHTRISIVTPSYNQAEFLERTILSVLNQNYPNLEYIIIDGGSTDGSVEIIKKYEKYLTYWVSEPDEGQSDAINKGLNMATGEIFAYLNSDDIYLPSTLLNISKLFEDNSDCDVIYGHAYVIDHEDNIKKLSVSLPFDIKEHLYGNFSIPQQSSFWRREVFERVGGFNTNNRTCMDGEFYGKAGASGFSFKNVNEVLAGFRLHSSSISGSGRLIELYKEDKKRLRKDILGYEPSELNLLLHKLFYKIKYAPYKLKTFKQFSTLAL